MAEKKSGGPSVRVMAERVMASLCARNGNDFAL